MSALESAPDTVVSGLRLGRGQLVFELIRPWALFAAFLGASAAGAWWIATPLAFATFLAGFVQLHDAMHAAFGLPKWANELVVTFAGLLLLKSGHGLRVCHLRHHGRTLAHDDPEGGVVHWPLWRVIVAGPFHVLGNRTLAMRLAPRNAREQIGETVLNVATAGFAVVLWTEWGSPAGLLYWGIAFALSATLSLWAAYIPHVLPETHPLVRLAGGLSQVWTPVLNSFAFHDLHHRFPKVPTALLGKAAKAVKGGCP